MTNRAEGAGARALVFLLLAFLAFPALAVDGPPDGLLVAYSFDDELTETGPDTFRVFANAKGTVRLSRAYRLSGDSSVEIRDAAGDREFPELQGRFPRITAGTLHAHFALLTTTPLETFNVALAGPAGFRLARNGIAFWLRARGGFLFHTSDSIAKKILELEPFTWYVVDVTYRVETGAYDLVIRREGDAEPRVSFLGVPNAASQPGSAVDTFSFVGDVEDDESNVVYYVDDVAIGTDRKITSGPFVAPGRRRFFVDSLLRERSRLQGRPGCLPFSEPEDLGLDESDVAAMKAAGTLDLFEAILTDRLRHLSARVDAISGRPRNVLDGAADWRRGCRALAAGDGSAALLHFQSASGRSPGRMYRLSSALALAALSRFTEADDILAEASAEWAGDPRYTLALAAVGATRGDLRRAEEILRVPAGQVFGEAAAARPEEHPDGCEARGSRMLAEEYFVALLLNGFVDTAAAYADRMIEHLETGGRSGREWREKRGDAAFFAGDLGTAMRLYEGIAHESPAALLKLADVHFKLGDLPREKALRERIYGSLNGPAR
ncbi:MAG: hypothetical protein ABI768_15440 [Acidobacteriota bacterium]